MPQVLMAMEEELQPKGANIVKDLLEAMVGGSDQGVPADAQAEGQSMLRHATPGLTRCHTQGVKHYDAAVVTQLLEFLYRYTSDVLECAQVHPTDCCPMVSCTLHANACNCPLPPFHEDVI